MFADVICFGHSEEKVGPRYYAICASRRKGKTYFFTEEDIKRTYHNNLCVIGDYPEVLADLMGDRYFMAKFEDEEDALVFSQYVTRRSDVTYPSGYEHKFEYLVGEDKRMMEEKNGDMSSSDDLSICDKHIDGA